jgi:hypothetical protein
MPDNNIDLKIINDDFRYDLNKHIYFQTNIGKVKMDFKDALEIMHTLLDATGHLDKQAEELIFEIEDEFVS